MSAYSDIKRKYEEKGHQFFTGKYAINLFGIRQGYETVDEFNDILGMAFNDAFGNEVVLYHEGTTKPGYYWLKTKKGNSSGTAILQPGQYLNCWELGKHNGKYDALRQKGMPFKVWRDGDSDGHLDVNGPTFTDVTGLNMHTTSFKTNIARVGAYSAGCQVRQHDEDHIVTMKILAKAFEIWKNPVFSYTLFDD